MKALALLALCLVACGGPTSTQDAGDNAPTSDPIYSVDAARAVAASHCEHLSQCAMVYGTTVAEATCEDDETSVLASRPLLCSSNELYDCEGENRSPYCADDYPREQTGGFCAHCFQ